MIYDFDLPKIIRRYVPTWFRWPANLQLGYALLSRLKVIHTAFMAQRDVILAEYKYNGLVHSMENACNDAVDPLLRRIYITVDDQLAILYFQDEQDPPIYAFQDEDGMAGYAYMDEAQAVAASLYDHEFIVHVPSDLGNQIRQVQLIIELYRYAGRRPRYEFF